VPEIEITINTADTCEVWIDNIELHQKKILLKGSKCLGFDRQPYIAFYKTFWGVMSILKYFNQVYSTANIGMRGLAIYWPLIL
jgi:hypothetical protein